MSLPSDFESVIKKEYGNFGWELANSFSFVAEFLGYKVFDISAVEDRPSRKSQGSLPRGDTAVV